MGQKDDFPMHKNQEDKQAMQDVEIKERLSHIKNKILVMSGKGGVGKAASPLPRRLSGNQGIQSRAHGC